MTARPMIEGSVVAKGVMWRVIEVVGSEALAFGSFVVLARLLIPEDFGVVSQATLLIMMTQLVLQQGLPEALVQKQDLSAAHFDTPGAICVPSCVSMSTQSIWSPPRHRR